MRMREMSADLLPNFLPTDLEAAGGCGNELTPAESEASGVTVDGSKCFSLDDAITSPGLSKEWTDEKHNLYINSLEQSFLDQLQHSKTLCGGGLSKENGRRMNSLWELPVENFASSDEVLQEDCWKNIDSQMNEERAEDIADSRELRCPRRRHFISGSRLQSVQPFNTLQQNIKKVHVPRNSTFSTGLVRTSIQKPLGSAAEVSDQNFVEEYKEKSSYGRVSTGSREVLLMLQTMTKSSLLKNAIRRARKNRGIRSSLSQRSLVRITLCGEAKLSCSAVQLMADWKFE